MAGFAGGVAKYLLEAACSLRYSPPFSSYSALVMLASWKAALRDQARAPYHASRAGFSETDKQTAFYILKQIYGEKEISMTAILKFKMADGHHGNPRWIPSFKIFPFLQSVPIFTLLSKSGRFLP